VMRMKDVRDIAALLMLLVIVLWFGNKLYDLYLYYNEPTITVESVEFNESCVPTNMFVIDMKGYPLRVFDCGE